MLLFQITMHALDMENCVQMTGLSKQLNLGNPSKKELPLPVI